MNSGNNKTSDPHRPLLNLLDKINLKRSDIYIYIYIYIPLLNFSIHYI